MIALPVSGFQVAPIFDLSPWVMVSDPKKNGMTKLNVQRLGRSDRVKVLLEAGVKTVICGCISGVFQNMLERSGIRVIWGIAGPLKNVLESFALSRLDESEYRVLGRGERPLKRRKPFDWVPRRLDLKIGSENRDVRK